LNFAESQGVFGNKWAVKYKGHENDLPNILELMEGLLEWFVAQMEKNMINFSE